MKINSHEVIYIPSFLKLRLYKSRIIKDNRFAGPKMKRLWWCCYNSFIAWTKKPPPFYNCRQLSTTRHVWRNILFLQFQRLSMIFIRRDLFFLNYNYMEVWIKDVWKNSKYDSDNKRHLNKKEPHTPGQWTRTR